MEDEEQRKKMKIHEDSHRKMWHHACTTRMYVMVVPGGESEITKKYIFEEIMTKSFPNLLKNIDAYIH